MRKSSFILCIVLSVPGAYSFVLPETPYLDTQRAISYIVNNRYDAAFDYFAATDSASVDPLTAVLYLATLGMRDVDFEMSVDSAAFSQRYCAALNTVLQLERNDGSSSYSCTVKGLSQIMYATFFLRQKKYVSAAQHGFDALKTLKLAQELDSTNHDVDFFLGLYEYARSELRARLWWVMFWYPGSRTEGIKRLEACATHGTITRVAAKLSLCDIYTQEKHFERAAKLIYELKNNYPQSRFVYWAEAKYFEATQEYRGAAAVYDTLHTLYALCNYGEYNMLSTRLKQAEMSFRAGDRAIAAELCFDVLHQRVVGRYKEIKKRAEKLLERINVDTH